MVVNNNVTRKAITNNPQFDDLYKTMYGNLGVVYFCLTNISQSWCSTKKLGDVCNHKVPKMVEFPGLANKEIFHKLEEFIQIGSQSKIANQLSKTSKPWSPYVVPSYGLRPFLQISMRGTYPLHWQRQTIVLCRKSSLFFVVYLWKSPFCFVQQRLWIVKSCQIHMFNPETNVSPSTTAENFVYPHGSWSRFARGRILGYPLVN